MLGFFHYLSKKEWKIERLALSPSVLDWAARQVGASLGDVARKISVRSTEKIVSGLLTPAQAEKFSRLTNTPFGYLFLSSPPQERNLPIVDFRSLHDSDPVGNDFYAVYDDVRYKQDWFKEYLNSVGAAPRGFVGRFAHGVVSATKVAEDMRFELGLDVQAMRLTRNADELYGLIASAAERAGILVFKNGVVGNNTHRPLSVSQFRGFAIADALAPAIFVNGADAKAAWLFTLAHELAHIWFGDSGVSDTNPQSSHRNEAKCNAVAAEFLVPRKDFTALWESMTARSLEEKLVETKRAFKVSNVVSARLALELGFISASAYRSVYQSSRAASQESGGDFYRTLGSRNGKLFSERVATLAVSGKISLREAGRLLNTSPSKVVNYYERYAKVST